MEQKKSNFIASCFIKYIVYLADMAEALEIPISDLFMK